MKIQEFAERILSGKTLSEKLFCPGHFEDRPIGYQSSPLPLFPARPADLSVKKGHRDKGIPFPNVRKLEDIRQRGIVLHFFANHELLALELIALALLKFPEAPERFRLGLLNTLLEEQRHLQLYEARMSSFQVEFGEIPVNDFFWKCLSPMQSPKDFVVGMSLTFEQANLDYAQYYAKIFRQIGDMETADILEQVLRDEINHVRHGLQWFNQWKKTEQSEWNSYKDALRFPLTPARAKGIGFDVRIRRKAGFSENFISELALYSHSKGMVPNVFFFNPGCETEIARGKPGGTLTKSARQLQKDFTAIPLFFCKQGDVVLVEKRPTSAFLTKLKRSGLTLPEFVEFSNSGKPSLEKTGIYQRKIAKLSPWGWSPDSMHLLKPLFHNLLPGAPPPCVPVWNGRLKTIFSKAWSVALLADLLKFDPPDSHWRCDPAIVGRVSSNFEDLQIQSDAFRDQGFEHLVLKGAWGASGQNMIQLFNRESLTREKRRIDKILEQQKYVVLEPWLDKALDLSFHIDLQSEEQFSIAGITRFFTDKRGRYQGSVVGRFDVGMEIQLLKFLHHKPHRHQPKSLPSFLRSIAEHISPSIAQAGYAGPVGVDLLVYRDARKGKPFLRCKPIVEINPRFSMGRLSLELSKHLKQRRVGVWLILTAKEIQAAGFANIPDFARNLENRFPLLTTSSPQKISQGLLFTTDPAQGQGFASFLLVEQSLGNCASKLEAILGGDHPLNLISGQDGPGNRTVN